MSGSGRLQSDPLFQGLTRPATILGVSYMYFVINAVVSMIVFINTQNFILIGAVAVTVHLVGYLICLKEPRALELLLLKLTKNRWCNNHTFHGHTNSYDPY